MKLRKVLAIVCAASMLVSLAGCGGNDGSDKTTEAAGTTAAQDETKEAEDTTEGAGGEASGDTIKIGLSAKITGADAANGDRMVKAATMAVDEINEAGGLLGGRQVELVIEDDQTDNAAALNVANLFAGNDEICAVVGPWNSGQILAAGEAYATAGIPFLGLGTNPDLLDLGNDYCFLVRANDTIMASAAARLIIDELASKKVGIMYTTNEFGTGAMEIIQEACEAEGIEVIPEAINIGDTDVTGQILELSTAGVDCMVVWASDAEYVITARQAYELGLDVDVVASPAITMDQVRELCEPEWVEGWYSITDFVSQTDDPEVTAFCEKYAADYGEGQNAELYVADVYSSVKLLADAIERAGSTDREAIRDALAETEGFEMLQGVANCDESNAFIHSAAVAQIVDYTPVLYKTVEAE